MCLTTKNPTVRVATKDIIVYKLCNNVEVDKCRPEYYGYEIEYGVNKKMPDFSLSPTDIGDGEYQVEKGYHSFNKPTCITNTVFIIPKGAEYIEGYFGVSPSRVSNRIIYCGRNNMVNRFLAKLLFCN